jgi:hypothetical protein
MYTVKFSAYCGMSSTVDDPVETPQEARQIMADYIRRKREHGHYVSRAATRRPTAEGIPVFEIETESNRSGTFVTDDDGLLFVQHHTFECRECGYEHETEEARQQCMEDHHAPAPEAEE